MSAATQKRRRLGMGSVYRAATVEAARRGDRRVGTEHLVLALLALQPPDPGAVLLDRLGVDRQAARSRPGAP